VTSDIRLAQSSEIAFGVRESSILETLHGAAFQVGHFDLQVDAMPTPGSMPSAIIAVTPLECDASLRILPMDAPIRQHLPTNAEFTSLSRVRDVRVGQTLFMRYDMAHSGTSASGRRLHSILGPADLSVGYGSGESYEQETAFLRNKY
jgi:hypothetical protein